MDSLRTKIPKTFSIIKTHYSFLRTELGYPTFSQVARSIASRTSPYENPNNSAEYEDARKWYEQFNKDTIPRKLGKTEFSRSSGPGGQKVNKTSSKATTVWPMSSLQNHIPKILIPELRNSNYYVSSSDSISIQCDTYRDQTGNLEETHTRLHDEIKHAFKHRIPGVTSAEQREKVDQL
ncbi:peptidyl-tRNA hydrolase domain-containing protein [Xylogone sp. PMI_703]|nr:peptidyl-tRNA hydrolase domain-containing protein [Xylogone sp. PMI_703]